MAPMAAPLMNVDGILSEYGLAYWEDMAHGGMGSINLPTEIPFFDIHDRTLRIERKDNAYADVSRVLKIAHAYDCRAECSMTNGGAGSIPRNGENAFTPSPRPVREGVYTKEMSEEAMEDMIQRHVEMALVARDAGFDAVEFTTCAGTLLHNFLSPIFNQRTDQYGGSVENRARYPLMLFKRVREAIGDSMAIHVRLNGCDDINDRTAGITNEMAAEHIRMFQEYVDYISIFTGNTVTPGNGPTLYPTVFMPDATYADDIKKIREFLGDDLHIPLGLVGKIHKPELIEQLIAEGTADFIIMGRQSIADPDFVNKVKEGREEDIVPCQHCEICVSSIIEMKCKVNPLYFYGKVRKRIPEPKSQKKVAVIGGGIAGMQAAATAAGRGHMVTLFEESDALGGQTNLYADKLWFTKEIVQLREYLEVQVEKNNVEVRLNTKATPEMISEEGFDNAIVATGSVPIVPPIPGADRENVSQVIDCFGNEQKYGKKVVIIGGGQSACDAAIYLGEAGHEVTMIEQLSGVALKGIIFERLDIMKHLDMNHVDVRLNTTCEEITEQGVSAVTEAGEQILFEADNVILAVGNRPSPDADDYLYSAFDVKKVGDCAVVEDLMNCMHGGYDAGLVVGV